LPKLTKNWTSPKLSVRFICQERNGQFPSKWHYLDTCNVVVEPWFAPSKRQVRRISFVDHVWRVISILFLKWSVVLYMRSSCDTEELICGHFLSQAKQTIETARLL
jgi:hypothetical protein